MSSLTERILEIKSQVEEREESKHKAEGALEQVMAQINAEFECDNLKNAEELCATMAANSDKQKRQITKKTEELEQELKEQDEDDS